MSQPSPSRILPLAAALAFAALAVPAWPCQVPVFRYALERWVPSSVELVIQHRGPLDADAQRGVEALRAVGRDGSALANFLVRAVDLAAASTEAERRFESLSPEIPLPRILAFYGQPSERTDPFWLGPLTADGVRGIADSPLRREAALRLLAGDSIVWFLAEGTDPQRNAQSADTLAAALPILEEEIQLPELEDAPTSPPGPPLRLAFSTLRVAADTPDEGFFEAMLRHIDSDPPADEPLIVPVFGRGRSPGVIREAETDERTLRLAASFLCAECSCLIKEQNPGTDLLMAVDWEAAFAGGRLSDALPELPGPGALAAPAATSSTAAASHSSVAPLPLPRQPALLWRNLAAALAALAVLIAAGSSLVLARQRKGRH